MLNWNVPATAGPGGDVHAPLAALMTSLGRPRFAASLLDLAHAAFDANSMCVYRLAPQGSPVRYCSASRESRDRTGSCWRIYRDHIYRADRTFDAAFELAAAGALAIGHLTATEVRYAPHRMRIYHAHALLDRITVAGREPNGDLLTVNFYHHDAQGHFADRHLAAFETIAPTVIAAVRRDHDLQVDPDDLATGPEPDRVVRMASKLARREPSLTPRELAVCARLLIGMLYEGIAQDLGISLASVKTYRRRAFERLGIHFRNELYGLVIGSHPG